MASWLVYDLAKTFQFTTGTGLDFDTGATLKIMLVTASYTPNRATHDFKDDLGATEVTGINYTAGGIAVSTKVWSVTANVGKLTGDTVTWSQHAAGFSNARYAVMYDDTGTPSTSRLAMYTDLGSDRGNVSSDLALQFPTGLFTV